MARWHPAVVKVFEVCFDRHCMSLQNGQATPDRDDVLHYPTVFMTNPYSERASLQAFEPALGKPAAADARIDLKFQTSGSITFNMGRLWNQTADLPPTSAMTLMLPVL